MVKKYRVTLHLLLESANIAPNEKKPNINQVVAAAQAANIDHFINKLPLKYNTKIGNEGHGLSIGQKQRILIARAIYKKPKYLFLDEATNSLDTTNEYEIMKHLHSIMKGKTSIIIAHRLSTIKDADNIIVLDKGYIVEQGNYSQLLQKKGLFYSLVQKQMEFMP